VISLEENHILRVNCFEVKTIFLNKMYQSFEAGYNLAEKSKRRNLVKVKIPSHKA